MFISFIIPIYNRSNTIKRCLESIVHNFKNYESFEIIIVDDNSDDDSLSIIKDFFKYNKFKFKIIINKKNLGSNISRNLGYKEAAGDWCIFLDSDDEICLDQEKINFNFIKHSNFNMLSFRCKDKTGNLIGKKYKSKSFDYGYKYYINNFDKFPELLDCINKKNIDEDKPFNEQFKLGCEFISWTNLLKKNGKKIIINYPGRIYHSDTTNQISKIPKNRRSSEFYRAYSNFYRENSLNLGVKMKFYLIIRISYYFIFREVYYN